MYALFFYESVYCSLNFIGIFSDELELKLGVKKLWSWFYDSNDGITKLSDRCCLYNHIKVATIEINQFQNFTIKNYFNNEEEAYDNYFKCR